MPRLQTLSHLYRVATRAAEARAAMVPAAPYPYIASCPVSTLHGKVVDLLVASKRLSVPQLDLVRRCASGTNAISSSETARVLGGFTAAELRDAFSGPRASRPLGLATRSVNTLGRGCSAQDDAAEAFEPAISVDDAQGQVSSDDTLGEADTGTTPSDSAHEDEALKLDASLPEQISAALEEASASERARGDRRRKVISGLGLRHQWMDLLTVPGIGPRNMEKLVASGIAKVDELKQLYREKYRSDGTEKMVEFLRRSVGVQKHHATRISVFIKDSVDAEEDGASEGGVKPKKRLTFCVEGNISVGKTTFLHRIANETVELRDLVEIVPEPIGKWQDVGPKHFNILDAFYENPERYAYTFQNYVFVTRMMQEKESALGDRRLRLMERSVFSDRMVFVRAVHEAKWMSDAEISIYDSWFDPVVSAMPGLVPDAFIYLRATPDTCHRRLQSRNRDEETSVTIDYLRGLHEKHEQWLFPAERRVNNVLSVSQYPMGHREVLPPRLQDRVIYLQGDNVHTQIQKVPALVLDCEPSIDFSRDLQAKSEYARQVADFFQYVQSIKDGQQAETSSLVLPTGNGLLGPDGNLLRPDTFDGVNFSKQISKVCA